MIPRYAPNYGVLDLVRSFGTGETPGPRVAEVAVRLQAILQREHVVPTASGRGALWLLLLALDEIGVSGRVIIPGYTCNAVHDAAVLAGREVVTIDHDAGDINMSAQALEGRIAERDIVVATHQYGYPCDIEGIVDVATRAGAIVIEDIAAAFQGTIGGRPMGSFGMACFGSFDGSKLLNVPPKGGFVGTDDRALAMAVKRVAASRLAAYSFGERLVALLAAAALVVGTTPFLYRLFYNLNFTWKGRVTAETASVAPRLNGYYVKWFAEWQATILSRELDRLEEVKSRRASIMSRYRKSLASTSTIDVWTGKVDDIGTVIRFPIFVANDKIAFHHQLAELGVDTGFSFTHLATDRDSRNAWAVADSVLNLPTSPKLSDSDVDRVVAAVKKLSGA
ncbi:dTDP-4-amino-4,6-dideoxygalactose transaminase [Bosea sp. OAE506]|uniref:DegT/DnrJ/EryC1/StrS family aminotransferase n=1 Tax=Bosea sp. OAE506 TaxID=2663870 RepID=UPI00178A9386